MKKNICIIVLMLITTSAIADSLKCHLQYGDPANPNILVGSESAADLNDNNFIKAVKRDIRIESIKVVDDFFYRLDLSPNESNDCYSSYLAYGEARNSTTWVNSFGSLCPGDELLAASSVLNGTTLFCSIEKD